MDVNSKCNVDGVTSDSTGTDCGLWDTVDSDDLLLATDTPPPSSDDRHPPPFPLSPADQALARLSRAAVSEAANHSDRDGGSPTMETCDLRYHVAFKSSLEVPTSELGSWSCDVMCVHVDLVQDNMSTVEKLQLFVYFCFSFGNDILN